VIKAHLEQELPQRKQLVTQARSKVIKETENPFGDEDDEPRSPPAGPSRPAVPSPQASGRIESFSYVSKDKKKKEKDKSKGKRKPFNLEAEKEQLKATIADASMAATGLTNALQSVNRERERISENPAAVQRFEECKLLRRKVLRYVCHECSII
jgi:LAS seventeen-binding protein 5